MFPKSKFSSKHPANVKKNKVPLFLCIKGPVAAQQATDEVQAGTDSESEIESIPRTPRADATPKPTAAASLGRQIMTLRLPVAAKIPATAPIALMRGATLLPKPAAKMNAKPAAKQAAIPIYCGHCHKRGHRGAQCPRKQQALYSIYMKQQQAAAAARYEQSHPAP